MKRIVYTSGAVQPMGCMSNIDILRTSRTHNKAKDITGFLCRSRRVFAQVLEGPDESIEDLLVRIRRDRRHWGLCKWVDERIETRAFPDWSMALALCDDTSVFERLFNQNRTVVQPDLNTLMHALRETADAYSRAEGRLDG